jgi:hypothetical protein
MPTPLSILRESIKAVPAVKYALGLAGVASAVAIVRSFNLDYRVAAVGTVIMLLFMTVLVIFARLSSLGSPDFRLPALVFTWFSLLLVISAAFSMFSSIFFRWPVDLQSWIKPAETDVTRSEIPQAKREEPSRQEPTQVDAPKTNVGVQLSASCETTSDLDTTDQGKAITAAYGILRCLQKRQFAFIWQTQTSQFFKRSNTEAAFFAGLTLERHDYGEPTDAAQLVSITYRLFDPMTGIKGEIYEINFRSSYDVGNFYEQIVVLKENDGKFRLARVSSVPAFK